MVFCMCKNDMMFANAAIYACLYRHSHPSCLLKERNNGWLKHVGMAGLVVTSTIYIMESPASIVAACQLLLDRARRTKILSQTVKSAKLLVTLTLQQNLSTLVQLR